VAAAGAVRGWRQLQGGSGDGGSAESVGDGAPGAQATGGGTRKLRWGAQRRRGISSLARGGGGAEARAGSGWINVKECKDG
jgi:hypothetical protein